MCVTWLYKLFGKCVGRDELLNEYYEYSFRSLPFKRPRRAVIYRGHPEPSKLPVMWYRWLHYQTDVVPKAGAERVRTPNLTGTVNAYQPEGHPEKKGKRVRAVGDYQRWRP